MNSAIRWTLAIALCGAVAAGGYALAQNRQTPAPEAPASEAPARDSAPGPRDGRYTMTPMADGFLRLDTRTGDVSVCKSSNNGVQCRAAADDRAALDSEIDRLTKENADLRRKLAAMTEPGPTARLRNALPSDEEVNKALGWMEQFMRRMIRIMRDDAPAGDRP